MPIYLHTTGGILGVLFSPLGNICPLTTEMNTAHPKSRMFAGLQCLSKTVVSAEKHGSLLAVI